MKETDQIIDRLAGYALRIWQGDETVFDDILRFPVITDAVREENQLTLTGVTGIRCGLPLGTDPATAVANLGFLFIGGLWRMVLPGLMAETSRRWKKEVDARKAKRSAAEASS